MIPKALYNKWENGPELLDAYIKSAEDTYNGLRSIAKISHTDLDYLMKLICKYAIVQRDVIRNTIRSMMNDI